MGDTDGVGERRATLDDLVARATDPTTAMPDRLRLTVHRSTTVRHAIAAATDEPQLLARLAVDAHRWVRTAVADNPATTPDILDLLAHDSIQVRAAVARNPSASPATVRTLSHDDSTFVRRAAATNPVLHVAVLTTLVTSSDERMRCALASNPALPDRLSLRLARDPEVEVRRTLAARSVCSPRVLRVLLADPKDVVRAAAAGHLVNDELAMLLDNPSQGVLGAIAAAPDCPPHLHGFLAESEAPDVRLLVARSPSCPPAALERLADDEYYAVRSAVLASPVASPATRQVAAFLNALADDASEAGFVSAIRWCVSDLDSPPDTSSAVRRRLLLASTDADRAILRRVGDHLDANPPPPYVLRSISDEPPEDPPRLPEDLRSEFVPVCTVDTATGWYGRFDHIAFEQGHERGADILASVVPRARALVDLLIDTGHRVLLNTPIDESALASMRHAAATDPVLHAGLQDLALG